MWPLELVNRFAAPALAAEAAAIIRLERQVLERAERLSSAFFQLIPTLAERDLRGEALALKRQFGSSSRPVSSPGPRLEARLRERLPDALDDLASDRSDRIELARRRDSFTAHHGEEIGRQRQVLAELSGEPRFGRALAIANPEVAERWERAGHRVPGERARHRRLEASVLQYLIRAASRPTPNGGWAGVANVRPAEAGRTPAGRAAGGLFLEDRVARYHVAVDLWPFSLMVRWLAAQDRYRRNYPLRVNPTLHRRDGRWWYEQPGTGDFAWAQLPAGRFLDVVVAYLRDAGPQPVEPLLAALGVRNGGCGLPERLAEAVSALLDRGVLESDLRLPAAAADVWTALGAVTPQLVEPDRTRWATSVSTIGLLCAALGERFERLTPAEVAAERRAVEMVVRDLGVALGVPHAFHAAVVTLDLGLPFAVTWGLELRETAAGAARDLLAFHAADGAAEDYRRASLAAIAQACPPGVAVALREVAMAPTAAAVTAPARASVDRLSFTRAGIFRARFGPAAPVMEHVEAGCRAWEEILAPVHDRRVHTLGAWPSSRALEPGGAGPFGALTLIVAGAGLWAGWGRPQPGLFATRVADVLVTDDRTATSVIGDIRKLTNVAAAGGVELSEIVGTDATNLSAAVGPALAESRIEPGGPGDAGIDGLAVVFDRSTWRPWLVRDGNNGRRLLPVYNSAAAIGHRSPLSRTLWVLAMSHGWEFVSFGFPLLEAERANWGHLPRLVLPNGTVLSAERWVLAAEVCTRLARRGELGDSEGYLYWRAEIEQRGIPDMVRAAVDDDPNAPAITVRTDSPLVVRCLLDRMQKRQADMVLSELPAGPKELTVRDADGRGLLAELAVTWHEPGYFDRAPGGPADE